MEMKEATLHKYRRKTECSDIFFYFPPSLLTRNHVVGICYPTAEQCVVPWMASAGPCFPLVMCTVFNDHMGMRALIRGLSPLWSIADILRRGRGTGPSIGYQTKEDPLWRNVARDH